MTLIERRLAELVDLCSDDAAHRGVLSSGERIAVAIVLDRQDWLAEDKWSSAADAVAYIDVDWQIAVDTVKFSRSSTGGRPATPDNVAGASWWNSLAEHERKRRLDDIVSNRRQPTVAAAWEFEKLRRISQGGQS